MFIPNLSSFSDTTVLYLHDGMRSSRSLLAIGYTDIFQTSAPKQDLFAEGNAWLEWNSNKPVMTAIGYDLKNQIERLSTRHTDPIGFPDLMLFVPETLLSIEMGEVSVIYESDVNTTQDILERIKKPFTPVAGPGNTLQPKVTKDQYIDDLSKVLTHIKRGDIYEMNYCQEFFSNQSDIHPFSVYLKLHNLTQAPFSVYLHHEDSVLLCGSPERYLKRTGNKIISQPIKGTTKRGTTPEEDALLISKMENDPKERAENIMITDLVRNDLSKSAISGSVNVEELCAVHTFKTVHQMISTVSAEVEKDTSFLQLIQDSFPMGSMTGAPKVSAMQIIDTLERSRRGLYSGSVGYIAPNGDFDLNVVIRSLLYNKKTHYLSALVGGAITSLSDPEKEYEECLLKADALFKALQ